MSPDNTDDWMNPPKRPEFVWKDDRQEKPFEILRERTANWPPGATEWATYQRFATAKERDETLKKLHSEHPAWHLKPSHYKPWRAFGINERIGSFP
jgi:hypothetical protein